MKVKLKLKVKSLICVQLFATPWTVANQAPPSMEFSRQEHWSGLPCPPPRDLPNPGIKPGSPALQADALPSEPRGKPVCKFRLTVRITDNPAALRYCKTPVCPPRSGQVGPRAKHTFFRQTSQVLMTLKRWFGTGRGSLAVAAGVLAPAG